MKILIIHGPNLNMLGKRDPKKYGRVSLGELNQLLMKYVKGKEIQLTFFQSNHEGSIIDFLQNENSKTADGILINPGALVRYGWSLRQAFIDLGKPLVEVHMSDINITGIHKSENILEDIRIGQVVGLKEKSYIVGLEKLLHSIK